MHTSYLGQNNYFKFFIDDLKKISWVYFLSDKSQAFSVFNKFKAFVERQSGCKLKTLRSKNGGDYTLKEFNKYCEGMWIDYKLTISYSPERMESERMKKD